MDYVLARVTSLIKTLTRLPIIWLWDEAWIPWHGLLALGWAWSLPGFSLIPPVTSSDLCHPDFKNHLVHLQHSGPSHLYLSHSPSPSPYLVFILYRK